MFETEKIILVIDDDPDIVDLISFNLKKEGFTIKTAQSGIDAIWKIMNENPPHCILLDIMMPSPDGLEICQFLKQSPKYSSIPVVIISAKGDYSDIQSGFVQGADAYLPKPFSITTLLKVIHDVLNPTPSSSSFVAIEK